MNFLVLNLLRKFLGNRFKNYEKARFTHKQFAVYRTFKYNPIRRPQTQQRPRRSKISNYHIRAHERKTSEKEGSTLTMA